MNDIFNPDSKFCVIYIDDVLIFSNSTEQHFKHLQTFFQVIETNGLVVLKSKISLFQKRVWLIGHYITHGTITPIERSFAFASKFSNKILDKTQL